MGQETGKTTGSEEKKQRSTEGTNWGACATVLAAVIGAIATIIVAIANSSVIIKWLEMKQTPSPTISPSFTPLPVTQIINTVDPLVSPTSVIIQSATSVSPTNPPEFTPTVSNLSAGMRVIITASRTSGKAPLNINFNAGNSYLLTDDGSVIKCGACSYIWSIRLGSNFIYGPEKKDATFSYTFQKKGSYFVIAKVCRNAETEVCGSTGIYIVAN